MSDVVIGSLTDNQLLTYNQTTNKWINSVKPTYSINELTNYDNTIAPIDNDYLWYNVITDKWQPQTFEQEAPNYLSLW